MVRGADWSTVEVEACVDDYLLMLTLELNDQRYNKTEHAERLMGRLNNRTRQSIEFKHCNISAVLLELGYPPIRGYKPRGNYQALLADVVGHSLMRNHALDHAVEAAVERPAVGVAIPNMDLVWVNPPKATHRPSNDGPRPAFKPTRRDYLAQEARNKSLGLAGELFVVELESRRLMSEGKRKLSQRVEHVASTVGDGLGYDVLSFDTNGQERFIEVKTTSFGELTPFYVSSNEVARSEEDQDKYHLFRVFDFRNRPRVFGIRGTITEHFQLNPVSYLARIA